MIYIIDNSNNDEYSHYNVYRNTLLSINGTYNSFLLRKAIKNKVYRQIKDYFDFVNKIKSIPKESIIHFLYGDCYYAFSWLYFFSKKRKIIVTMHSCPEGRLRRVLLKIFCKKISLIIVHSEYTKNQYQSLGIENIECVDYPSFYDYSNIESKKQIRERYKVPENKIIISALGGTRYDKGLDILLESFQYIDKDVKERILLNIAGREEFFKEKFIKEKQEKHKISCMLNLKGLSDKEFMENVLMSDFLVFPYRKIMTGNSGPMTEAIVNSIVCIVSDYGNIGNIAKAKQVGVLFKSESSKDLAEIITKEIILPTKLDFSYKEELSITTFIERHRLIYNKF